MKKLCEEWEHNYSRIRFSSFPVTCDFPSPPQRFQRNDVRRGLEFQTNSLRYCVEEHSCYVPFPWEKQVPSFTVQCLKEVAVIRTSIGQDQITSTSVHCLTDLEKPRVGTLLSTSATKGERVKNK